MVLKTDVFVAGGGPAGLAAAIAARQRGLDVTVADPGQPGQDKACGEGVMPDGIDAARALGVELAALESFPFRGIRFHGAGKSVAADFAHGPARGIRRTVLHRALADHAVRSGVRLLWGCRVEGLTEGAARIAGGTVRACYIIGADGTQSRVRAWSGVSVKSFATHGGSGSAGITPSRRGRSTWRSTGPSARSSTLRQLARARYA